jgi:site-specific DNA-methyltransferase (adenine-specific)
MEIKCKLYHDNFQNYKRYGIPKAQLVVADIPYNLGVNAYASNPMWYNGGDNKNGESKKAGKAFFNGDGDFNLNEYFHFCGKLLKKEPKEKGQAPCMIVFCAFEQMFPLIEIAKTHGYMHYIPLIFCKNYSAQVLKANMKVVGATEYALVLYRDKLPKFNNIGVDGERHMIFNWFEWKRDSAKEYPKIHPTQKPVSVLKRLIETFTDPGDVVIDPCAGSGSTLRAARELGRHSFGFEVNTSCYKRAAEEMLAVPDVQQMRLMEV